MSFASEQQTKKARVTVALMRGSKIFNHTEKVGGPHKMKEQWCQVRLRAEGALT